MRGLAVLAGAMAAWTLVTGVPSPTTARVAVPRSRTLAAVVAAGLGGLILAQGLTGVPSAALAMGTMVSVIPLLVASARARRRRDQLVSAWPDVLARMRARVAGGSTLVDAFLDGIEAAPADLREQGRAVADAVRYGAGFEAALVELRRRLGDPVSDQVLMSIASAHASGGRRVGDMLSAMSGAVADELRLRRAHDAAMTEQRLTAGVALVAPWALLALTIATNPQAASAYRSSTGTMVIFVGLLGTGVGYLISMRSARLSDAPRMFE